MKNTFMKIKALSVLTLGVVSFSSAAHAFSTAGIFLEPALTYETSNSTITWPSPLGHSTGSADGLGLGLRFGVHFLETFFVGLDGRYAQPTFKDSSVSYNASSTSTNWGPVVGAQMPGLGLRVWATYIAGAELNPKSSGNYDSDFKDGKGYRIGAGFHVLDVSLNLEYQNLKYDTTNLQDVYGINAGTVGGSSLQNDSWIASVSFPIEM